MQMSTLTSLCIFVWNFLWSRKVKPQHWAAETNSWKQMSLWPSPWVPINSLITAEFLGADNITLPRSNGFDCWDKAIWLHLRLCLKINTLLSATRRQRHWCIIARISGSPFCLFIFRICHKKQETTLIPAPQPVFVSHSLPSLPLRYVSMW